MRFSYRVSNYAGLKLKIMKIPMLRLAIGIAGFVSLCGFLNYFYPPDLTRYTLRSKLVLSSKGDLLRPFAAPGGIWRISTKREDVDSHYLSMLISYEDKRFYRHLGVDPLAFGRAFVQWMKKGRPVSGASTLTMQVVRLLEPRRRTVISKIIESLRALQLEMRYSKDQILAMYLTLTPMGGNLEGVRAGSLAYFGKEPRRLTILESALLVSLPQAPSRRRPDLHPKKARMGAEQVLNRLWMSGALSKKAVSEAREEVLPTRREPFPFLMPRLAEQIQKGIPAGAEVQTTISISFQKDIESLVHRESKSWGNGASAAAIVAKIDTGNVLAYIGGTDFWAPAGQINLARTIRSPGSALKPFVYGIAMDDSIIHPETILEDRPLRIGAYEPRNFNKKFQGDVTARFALQHSLNIPAVSLINRIGPVRFAGALRQAGANLKYSRSDVEPNNSIVLGGVGISLFDLVGLYTALGEEGVPRKLRVVNSLVKNKRLPRMISKSSAWHLKQMLSGTPRPRNFQNRLPLQGQRDVSFKTGTSYGYRDAWAIGYSQNYVVGVWVGRPDGAPRPGSTGQNTAAPLMLRIFDILSSENESFRLAPPPPGTLVAHANSDLPIGLKRFSPEGRFDNPLEPNKKPSLHISYPPNGSQVTLLDEGGGKKNLFLHAKGGVPPVRWWVNGEPISASSNFGMNEKGHQNHWIPDGKGFVRLRVVDNAGHFDTSLVRIR